MTNDKNDVDITKNWSNMVKIFSLEKNVNILSVQCYLISRRHLFDGSQALTTNTDKKSSIKMTIGMEHWWNDTDREKLKHSVKIRRIEEYKP